MPQSHQQLETYELFKNQIASIIHQHPDWTAVRIAEEFKQKSGLRHDSRYV